MRGFIFLVSACAVLLTAGVGKADWLNPTSYLDCRKTNWTIYDQLVSAREAAHQCHRDNWGTPGNGYPNYTRVCQNTYGQWEREIPACSGMEQRVCKLSHEIEKREQMCNQRLAQYQARQEALEAQQEELARQQREAERSAQEGALSNQFSDTAGSFVRNRYGSLPDGPARLAGDARATGENIARLSGVRMTGQNGAYALSNAMTDIGTQLMGRMTQQAMGDLETGLQNYSATNPRPTEAQLESYRQEQAALSGRYAEHMTRVERADPDLPLGDESAVVGNYVDTVLELVQMRNSGKLDEPIAALGAGVATVLAVKSYQEIERRADSEQASEVFEPASAAELRAARQSVAAPVKEARARVAAERRARIAAEQRERAQQNQRSQSTPRRSSLAAKCMRRGIGGSSGRLIRVWNACSRVIVCNLHLTRINGTTLPTRKKVFDPNIGLLSAPRQNIRVDGCRYR